MNTAQNPAQANLWADLEVARAAKDESVIRAFIRRIGHEQYLELARSHVAQARQMFGLEATFCYLDVVERDNEHEVGLWYFFDSPHPQALPAIERVSFWTDSGPTAPVPATPRPGPATPRRRRGRQGAPRPQGRADPRGRATPCDRRSASSRWNPGRRPPARDARRPPTGCAAVVVGPRPVFSGPCSCNVSPAWGRQICQMPSL